MTRRPPPSRPRRSAANGSVRTPRSDRMVDDITLPQKQKSEIYLAACGIPPSSSGVPPTPAVFTASGGRAQRQSLLLCVCWQPPPPFVAVPEVCGAEGAAGSRTRVWPVWASSWLTPAQNRRASLRAGTPGRAEGGGWRGYREEGRELSHVTTAGGQTAD